MEQVPLVWGRKQAELTASAPATMCPGLLIRSPVGEQASVQDVVQGEEWPGAPPAGAIQAVWKRIEELLEL